MAQQPNDSGVLIASDVTRGLDRDLAEKQAQKYDPAREREAREWIETVINEPLPASSSFHECLKDGTVLCRLISVLAPQLAVKHNTSRLAFKQMENIANFLSASEKLGVKKAELFQTVDLYEEKNMVQVIDFIYALSRNASAQGYRGPLLGPKLSEKRELHFSDEQLAAGKTIIGQQYGYTGGATQSGMSFGNRRPIANPNIATGDESSASLQSGVGNISAGNVSFGNRRDIGGHDPAKLFS